MLNVEFTLFSGISTLHVTLYHVHVRWNRTKRSGEKHRFFFCDILSLRINVDPAETRTPAVRTVWGTYEGYETSETCFGKPSTCVIPLQLAFIPKAAQILRSKKISNPNPAPSANPNPRIGDFGKMPDFAFDSL